MQRSIALNSIIFILVSLKCCASFNFTNQNYDIQVGVPFTLTWEDAEGAVILGLLFKNTSSSPQDSYIIATGITESQFAWTPPDWTSGVFEQKIEAQVDKNLTLTRDFTISKAATNAASTALSSSISAKTATTQPTSANSASADERTTTQTELSSAAKARIGFGICIVVVLIIIGVALIFFEHGKRVAARSELRQPKSPLGRAEQGSMGLELIETNLTTQKSQKEVEKEIMEEPLTPLLYKKPKLAVELDGGVINNAKTEPENKIEEEKKKRVLSMRSIYELG